MCIRDYCMKSMICYLNVTLFVAALFTQAYRAYNTRARAVNRMINVTQSRGLVYNVVTALLSSLTSTTPLRGFQSQLSAYIAQIGSGPSWFGFIVVYD